MADKKISQLTAATTPLAGTEVLPIVQSGSTVKVAVSDLTAGRDVAAKDLTTTGNTILGNASSDTLNVGNGNIIKDAAGNTGFNVTPSAWATFNAVQFGPGGALLSTGVTSAAILTNLYYDGAAYRLIGTGAGSRIVSTAGAWAFVSAASGSAGDAATLTTRFQISAAGDATNNTGNYIVGTAGKGIDFSANTHAAGMTSELLNWYEEGTWTPVGNNIALTTASGTYVRVGSLVTVFFEIVFPTTADTSPAQVSGLPFSASTNIRNGAALGFTTDTTGNTLLAYNSVIQIYNTAGAQTTNANNSTKQYYGSLSFRV